MPQLTQAPLLYPDVTYWEQNGRKGGLSERRIAIIKEYNFYNQQYCGCEFSMRKEEMCIRDSHENAQIHYRLLYTGQCGERSDLFQEMCIRDSHTAWGKSFNAAFSWESIGPPPIMRCLICRNIAFSSGTCSEL